MLGLGCEEQDYLIVNNSSELVNNGDVINELIDRKWLRKNRVSEGSLIGLLCARVVADWTSPIQWSPVV
jgi:hypothetical protein